MKIFKPYNSNQSINSQIYDVVKTDLCGGINNGIDSLKEKINTLEESLYDLEQSLCDLDHKNVDLSISIKHLQIKDQNFEAGISSLNKKSELLFKQLNNMNKMFYSYISEQLYNIEKLRLEVKRENLFHAIEEEITEKRIMWIVSLPWYKKITRKQQIKLITKLKEIHDEIYKKYDFKIKMIDLEIKNHTREKYFAKLENTLKTIKGEK